MSRHSTRCASVREITAGVVPVTATYAGLLTAVLAIPSYEKPIDSLWDLLHAVRHKAFVPIVFYGGVNEFIFKVG